MKLEVEVSDDMQLREAPIKRPRPRLVSTYKPLTRAEYIHGHRLLLAQALAISFVINLIGEAGAGSE